MSILLFGDIAIPYEESINIDDIKKITYNKNVIADLEGPIIDKNKTEPIDKNKYNLYTDKNCIDFLKELNINYLSFANNHILDFDQPVNETIKTLERHKIDYFGTYDKPYLEFTDSEEKYVFGTVSYITGSTSNKYDRINEFRPKELLIKLRDYKIKNPAVYLIIFVHWGYELAKYPQPADREWAIQAIEQGANAIIGHHTHVMQGVESFKNGIIIYSLGNFILPQVEFAGRALSFNSKRVNSELGIEINPENDEITLHYLYYDKSTSKLLYKGKTNDLSAETTPFNHLSIKQYRIWYDKHKHEEEYKPKYNIYPTFYSYFRFHLVKYQLYKLFLSIFRILRRIAIRTGLHTPYNWNENS